MSNLVLNKSNKVTADGLAASLASRKSFSSSYKRLFLFLPFPLRPKNLKNGKF